MKTFLILMSVLYLAFLQGCGCSGCDAPPPPPAVIFIRTFYKNSGNADLLDATILGSFKEKDVKVTTTVEQNGIFKELDTSGTPIKIEYDDDVRKNYFGLLVPTNYKKNPIRTVVQLSPTISDTVTYTFLSKERPYIPDKIFYI
jgi:hypothetical protein